ncbi:MAG TPA: NrfD/PsrC family molybdoenzyme membrane anchor subunit, partial [Flavobacteriaceae bacterium]|nr:NrfD/PsrC family molybdoenzyme membrane anchor subunit [Flavobacteriaceae bacterium]
MKYGFIIDNRKCIGCHACTTACKSEHDVPIGVNRTYVKQVEKGTFPNTRRIFSVMRCNHCTHAPCVTICPVEALFTREDGIVDFDNNRCIGCKSCMQACPYDALYIDPNTNTAAKCNYCAHRVEVGREPACVSVCPEHAIIAGDIDNPNTEISQLLARQAVKVRKPEKGTSPNLFYIDADDASLNPEATAKTNYSLWNAQARGVGHYAKAAEKLLNTNTEVDLLQMTIDNTLEEHYAKEKTESNYLDVLSGKARRVYDTPNKGLLWGWEVSAYVFTKAIAAGVILIPILLLLFGFEIPSNLKLWFIATSLVFLSLTGLFLVLDLDRPDRFLNVLLRPQWNSWLVKGGYILTFFGLFITVWGIATFFNFSTIEKPILIITAILAIGLAVYTAFLFAQAKGRDFWQSPILPLHMLVHSIMAGTAAILIISYTTQVFNNFEIIKTIAIYALLANFVVILSEILITHPTTASKKVINDIIKGNYKNLFWIGTVLFGNILPLLILITTTNSALQIIASL